MHTLATKVLLPAHAADEVAIAFDASWIAFVEHIDRKLSRLVIVDREGHERARRLGGANAFARSDGGLFAAASEGRVFVIRPSEPAPAFVEAPLPHPTWVHYLGRISLARVLRAMRGRSSRRTARVLIATGKRLLHWDATVDEIASFEAPIDQLSVAKSGVVITLVNKAVVFLPNTVGSTPQRISMLVAAPTVLTDDQKLAYAGVGSLIQFVELPSLAHWSLPKAYIASPVFSVAPSGHRVLQRTGGGAALWTLPEAGSDVFAWLDELTNGVEAADNHLAWPWQAPKVAPRGSTAPSVR